MNPIRHIEMWASDMKRSIAFYEPLLTLLGWQHIDANGFSCDGTKIYFRELDAQIQKTLGPRHICFQAQSNAIIDEIADLLKQQNAEILHGPAVIHEGGSYMIVFKDPDGYILEAAYKE